MLFQECLAHGHDICPDCLLEKTCGDVSQTDECDFMKKSQVNQLVKQQTTQIQGKVNEINGMKLIGLKFRYLFEISYFYKALI